MKFLVKKNVKQAEIYCLVICFFHAEIVWEMQNEHPILWNQMMQLPQIYVVQVLRSDHQMHVRNIAGELLYVSFL